MKMLAAFAALLLLVVAAARGAEPPEVAALAEGATAQENVGALAGQAAAGFSVLAEETAINFGGEKASGAERGREVLRGVAHTDVPEVLKQLAALRSAAPDETSELLARIASHQDDISSKIRGVMDPNARGLALESVREKAQAIADAQAKAKKAAGELASTTLGKTADALTPAEQKALAALRSDEDRAAADVASLAAAARDLAADPQADPRTKDALAKASAAADLDAARQEIENASKSIAENKLGQAVSSEDAAARSLSAFKDALDSAGRQALADKLDALKNEEKDLAAKTAAAAPGEMPSLAGEQKRLEAAARGEAARAAAESAARNSLAQANIDAAAAEMAKATAALSRAQSQSNAAADTAKSSALASQKSSSDYLDAAKDALKDPRLASLPQQMAAAEKDLRTAQARRDALDNLVSKQEDLKTRTEAASKSPAELQKLAAEEERLKNELAQTNAQTPPISQQNASASAKNGRQEVESDKGAPRPNSQGKKGGGKSPAPGAPPKSPAAASPSVGQKEQGSPSQNAARRAQKQAGSLSKSAGQPGQKPPDAMSAMQMAASSLSKADGKSASESQAQAIAAMKADAAKAGESASQSAQRIAELAAAAKGSSGTTPLPPSLQSMLAEAEAKLGSGQTPPGAKAPGSAKSPGPGKSPGSAPRAPTPSPGQSLASVQSKAAGATGLTGLSPGTPGQLGTRPGGETWLSTMPPGTPDDIVQGASGAFPRGYEETLRRYYEAIAKKDAQ